MYFSDGSTIFYTHRFDEEEFSHKLPVLVPTLDLDSIPAVENILVQKFVQGIQMPSARTYLLKVL
jgi:hypothetical protein